MTKIISLFNNKGGVSKTTTTFNLGWMLAEKGNRVLLVDTDPQCNLSGLCLSLSAITDFESFYKNDEFDNIKSALDPVFESKPISLSPAKCFEFPHRPNLFLLPGHIDFSDLDVSINIAQELTGSLKFTQNIPGAIAHLLRITGEEYKFDYILIDMSPSVSATNANLLMQSDYFIVPCSPDYFCNMAINSLCRIIPTWYSTYTTIKTHSVYSNSAYPFPKTSPKFIGTILQRYRPRNGEAAKSFQNWIDRIKENVNANLVPELKKLDLIVESEKFSSVGTPEEPYNLVNISDFNSLIAQSQKYGIPVFALKDEEMEQVGKILTTMRKNKEAFHNTFDILCDAVIGITS
ncbi:ParA family protein [Paenibacillus polymyxa]|uniref:ParA family protein n=1 Tax=Paenibacillus polymyxa TaxID=1406 RepID=UPI00211D55C4|nr:AAA family ATPase [Paenibacillus polymyxa]